MNDIMCKARRDFVAKQFSDRLLFDLTPDEEKVEQTELKARISAVVAESTTPLTRPELQLNLLLGGLFARLTVSEINKAVGEMLKDKLLFSSTGKPRINDTVRLSNKPF